MVAARFGMSVDPAFSSDKRYSGEFGAIGAAITHGRSPATDVPLSTFHHEEGLYVTTVDYLTDDALHSMRLRTGSIVTSVDYLGDDDAWIATDDASMEFGVGESWREAIEDYIENLHAMAFWFQSNDRPVGPHLEKRLQVFKALFHGL